MGFPCDKSKTDLHGLDTSFQLLFQRMAPPAVTLNVAGYG